ncbi:hypothetical protein [Nonomuraea sp. NPDC049758]
MNAGPLGRIPAATSRTAYAIAREALTNALRHGPAPSRSTSARTPPASWW